MRCSIVSSHQFDQRNDFIFYSLHFDIFSNEYCTTSRSCSCCARDTCTFRLTCEQHAAARAGAHQKEMRYYYGFSLKIKGVTVMPACMPRSHQRRPRDKLPVNKRCSIILQAAHLSADCIIQQVNSWGDRVNKAAACSFFPNLVANLGGPQT